MQKVLAIVGPTASGKSNLAIQLAEMFEAEIISADSVSIYKQYNIASAKPNNKQLQKVKHHLINSLSAFEELSIYRFQKMCRKCLSEIFEKNKLPILVGGSGLYIRASLNDYEFSENNEYKDNYEQLDNQTLKNMLDERDFLSSQKIHVNNRIRLIRALRICDSVNNKTQFEQKQKHQKIYDVLMIGIKKPRAKLYEDIEKRVDEMFEEGLLEEIEDLVKQKIAFNCSSFNKAIGYKEFKEYYDGLIDLEEVKRLIKKNTKNFAKRQETWFRHQEDVIWFEQTQLNEIVDVVKKWLGNKEY